MSTDIYQQIWDADQATNGLPALRQGETGSDAVGFVVVDERDAAVTPDHRVIADVQLPVAKQETYRLCERLFNNYTLDPGIREFVTEEETQEEMDFIEAIVPLPPLQVAKAFMESDSGLSISNTMLAAMIKETWFLQGKAGSKHASGFEHVFVGEQKPTGDKPDDTAVDLGGYHFWYKYYLDDAGDRLLSPVPGTDGIFYLGTEYNGADRPAQGILVPEIVTMEFRWNAPDFTAGGTQLLKKSIGGFWVGCSPEGLIALGLVRARTRAGETAKINGSTYGLDLHPLSTNRKSIRTFFPRFQRSDFCESCPPNGGGNGGGNGPNVDDGDVRIVAALVNPAGDESGRETVTLLNTAPTAANLAGWAIVAPNGWRFVFADVMLNSGEVQTFRMPAPSPQFRNREGAITLMDVDGVHHRVQYSTEAARREGYTIVF